MTDRQRITDEVRVALKALNEAARAALPLAGEDDE